MAAGAIGDVEESVSATLRFPNERLAAFSASFGATKVSEYRLVGTKGELAVDPASFHFFDVQSGESLLADAGRQAAHEETLP